MRRIGFAQDKMSDEDRLEERQIRTLNRELKQEMASCQDFEQRLIREIKEVQHLNANLQVISGHMRNIRKMYNRRHEFVARLVHKLNSREPDLNRCREMLRDIGRLDNIMQPSLASMTRELENLMVTKAHVLYMESDENKRLLHAIDDKAREMHAELVVMQDAIGAHNSRLRQISVELDKRDSEKSEVGF